MSDPTIRVHYADLLSLVGNHLGYGRTVGAYTTQQRADCDDAVESGYRQFLFPPPIPPSKTPYDWSFLTPITTLTTTAAIGTYDAPSDFGGFLGDMFITSQTGYGPVRVIDQERIREWNTQAGNIAGCPSFVAARPKVWTGAATAAPTTIAPATSTPTPTATPTATATPTPEPVRWEFLLWPIPGGAYTLEYRYRRLVNKLSTANPSPIFGPEHAETLRASCLASAELLSLRQRGLMSESFIERLAASIAMDSAYQPKRLGYNSDGSEGPMRRRGNRYSEYEGTIYGDFAP